MPFMTLEMAILIAAMAPPAAVAMTCEGGRRKAAILVLILMAAALAAVKAEDLSARCADKEYVWCGDEWRR